MQNGIPLQLVEAGPKLKEHQQPLGFEQLKTFYNYFFLLAGYQK